MKVTEIASALQTCVADLVAVLIWAEENAALPCRFSGCGVRST